MATFTDPPVPSPRPPIPTPDVGPIPVPAPARLIPPADPKKLGGKYSGLSLDALMARQKEIAARQAGMSQQQSPTIGAGLANLAWAVVNGLERRRAERGEAEGRQAFGEAWKTFDPATGMLAPEAMETVMQLAPEYGIDLYKGAMAARLAENKGNRYGPVITGEEAEKLGLDGTKSYQLNQTTGQYDPVGGGGGVVIDATGKGANKWEEVKASKLVEMLDGISASGRAAVANLAQVDQLEKLLPTIPTGSNALWTDYLKNNWGISLEGADQLQTFNAIISQLVPAQRPAGSGTMSDKDIELFRQSLPSMLNSPEGNKQILSYMRGIATYNAQLGQIAAQAQMQGDPNAARAYFEAEAAKLANPLANLRDPTAPDAATETPPTDPAVPADPAVADPNVPPMPPRPAGYAGSWPSNPADWAALSETSRAYYLRQAAAVAGNPAGGGGQ